MFCLCSFPVALVVGSTSQFDVSQSFCLLSFSEAQDDDRMLITAYLERGLLKFKVRDGQDYDYQ